MPGVLTIEAIAQAGAVAVLADEANGGKIPFFAGIDACRFKRVVEPGDTSRSSASSCACAARSQGEGRALVATRSQRGEAHVFAANDRHRNRRSHLDHRARVQGAGPGRVERGASGVRRNVDEWILARTGIRERRMAAKEEALSDVALPACIDALREAGVEGEDIDSLIVATVTPDMAFPSTAAILADALGAADAAAYDLSAGCTGFMYALAQAYGMLAGGLAQARPRRRRRPALEIMDWEDRSTCVLFGDGAGAVVLERDERRRLPRLRARGRRRRRRWISGSRERVEAASTSADAS